MAAARPARRRTGRDGGGRRGVRGGGRRGAAAGRAGRGPRLAGGGAGHWCRLGDGAMKRGMLATWARTLIVQASWNYDRMVGIGVAYAMEPLLRDLPGGRTNGRYAAALKRVAGFFNAHPYLTGMAAGALARVEYDGVPEAQADRLRRALIGPLGSVGDQLVWAGWLPMSVAVGLIVAVLVSVPAGVVSLLILYNVLHLGLRSWGLAAACDSAPPPRRSPSGWRFHWWRPGCWRISGAASAWARALSDW